MEKLRRLFRSFRKQTLTSNDPDEIRRAAAAIVRYVQKKKKGSEFKAKLLQRIADACENDYSRLKLVLVTLLLVERSRDPAPLTTVASNTLALVRPVGQVARRKLRQLRIAVEYRFNKEGPVWNPELLGNGFDDLFYAIGELIFSL